MNEFELIDRLLRPLATAPGARELKDDAATLALAPGHELVVTTDALVEGVHFLKGDPPERLARKALRVNLSDLAAKGAKPLGYQLVLGLRPGLGEAWLEAFAAGLRADQELFGLSLFGGDTVATGRIARGPLFLAVTAFGTLPENTMLTRQGAKPGDRAYVTGSIGRGALGLKVALGEAHALPAADCDALLQHYQMPEPRLAFGSGLRGLASASLDLSDGLIADAAHLARVSGVSLTLEQDAIPLASGADIALQSGLVSVADLLTGGDEYELFFTAPPAAQEALGALSEATGTPVTPIGTVTRGGSDDPPVRVMGSDGEPLAPFLKGGFEHTG